MRVDGVDGIDVRTDATVTAARREGDDTVVTLNDGSQLRCGVVVVGAGRIPRTADLGLDTLGITSAIRARPASTSIAVPRNGCGRSATSTRSCRSPTSPGLSGVPPRPGPLVIHQARWVLSTLDFSAG